jgi:hypothetical protein
VLDDLKARGHRLDVSSTPLSAAATALSLDPHSGLIRAAGDRRAGRHASAY